MSVWRIVRFVCPRDSYAIKFKRNLDRVCADNCSRYLNERSLAYHVRLTHSIQLITWRRTKMMNQNHETACVIFVFISWGFFFFAGLIEGENKLLRRYGKWLLFLLQKYVVSTKEDDTRRAAWNVIVSRMFQWIRFELHHLIKGQTLSLAILFFVHSSAVHVLCVDVGVLRELFASIEIYLWPYATQK